MNKNVIYGILTKEYGNIVTKFNIVAGGVTITKHRKDQPGRPSNVLYLTLDEMETIYGLTKLSGLASNNVED